MADDEERTPRCDSSEASIPPRPAKSEYSSATGSILYTRHMHHTTIQPNFISVHAPHLLLPWLDLLHLPHFKSLNALFNMHHVIHLTYKISFLLWPIDLILFTLLKWLSSSSIAASTTRSATRQTSIYCATVECYQMQRGVLSICHLTPDKESAQMWECARWWSMETVLVLGLNGTPNHATGSTTHYIIAGSV